MEKNLRHVMVGAVFQGSDLKPIIQYNYEMSTSSKNDLVLPLFPKFMQRGNWDLCCPLTPARLFTVCVSSAKY